MKMYLFLPIWEETECQLQSKNISEVFRIVPINHFNPPKNTKPHLSSAVALIQAKQLTD